MYPIICYICLRSDRKLRPSEEKLEHLYEELCEFDNERDCKFCSECIYKLKKFYDFKNTCLLSAKKLKWWRKHKSVRKPIDLLYTEMPPSQLGLLKTNNYKIYYCQEAGLEAAASIKVPDYRHPHVVSVNVPKDGDLNTPAGDFKPQELRTIKQENTEFAEVDGNDLQTLLIFNRENYYNTEIQAKNELNSDDDDDDDDDDDETSDLKGTGLNENESDSDASAQELLSLKELLSKLKQENNSEEVDDKDNSPSTGGVNNKTNMKRRKTIDKDNIIKLLRKKFERFGPVKDDKGTVINIDSVTGNLDSFTLKYLQTIYKISSRAGPFLPNDIRVLSRIQARFPYTSVFKITSILDNETRMQFEFEKRQSFEEYVNSKYRCESCYKGFKYSKLVDYHNKIQHNKSLPVECSLCLCRYKNKYLLYKHTVTSHAMVYECKLCNFITNYKAHMLKHYEKHKGSVGFNCKLCGEHFTFNSQMYIHIKKEHGSKHICEMCACAFHTPFGLAQHKTKKHEREGEEFLHSEQNKKCDECNILFISENIYRKHLRITHKASKSENNKVRSRKYACGLCEWEGHNLAGRKEHYALEHPTADVKKDDLKKFLCETCGKEFTNITIYKYHLNTHTGVRPFTCSVCQKSFFSLQCLKLHKERHFPPSRECKTCGKKYTSVTSLYRHQRIHEVKHHICHICGKVFLQNYLLKQHINGVHFHGYKKKKEDI